MASSCQRCPPGTCRCKHCREGIVTIRLARFYSGSNELLGQGKEAEAPAHPCREVGQAPTVWENSAQDLPQVHRYSPAPRAHPRRWPHRNACTMFQRCIFQTVHNSTGWNSKELERTLTPLEKGWDPSILVHTDKWWRAGFPGADSVLRALWQETHWEPTICIWDPISETM